MNAARLLSRLDLDATILFGAGRLALNTLSSLAMLVIVARTLNRVEQGYFYAFFSFFQVQAVLQAGAYVSLYAAVAHAWSRLRLSPGGQQVEGPADSLERMGGLMRLSTLWHRGCALAFALFLGPLGDLFFRLKDAGGVAWEGPWWLLSFAIAASFLILPQSLALEATGHTGAQQKAMFFGVLASCAAGVAGLLAGLGLYAVALMTLARVAVTAVLFHGPARTFARLPRTRLDWREEILPQQARTTVSWLLGFVVFLAAVPITFQVSGPVVAGRIGVAVQIYQAVTSIAGVWITRAQPRMGALAGQGEMTQLHRLVRSAGAKATVVGAGLALCAALTVGAIDRWAPGLGARFPGVAVVLIYAGVAAVGQWPGAMSIAVRLTRIEPFIAVTAAGSAATLAAYALLAPRLGELGVALGFLAVTVALVFPWTAAIYWRRIARPPPVPGLAR